jgi:uncharacterized protein YjbI with pentapeptide repeats
MQPMTAEELWKLYGEGRRDFSNLDLSHVELSFWNLEDAADVIKNILTGIDLSGSNLTKTYLCSCDLTDANLSGCNLTDTSFDSSKLINANLSNALLNGTSLEFVDLTGANLRGARLRGVPMTGANFTNADLTGGEFSGGGEEIIFFNTIMPDGSLRTEYYIWENIE